MIAYTADELLQLRQYDVTPPRRARKVIFSLWLWKPRAQRQQYEEQQRLPQSTPSAAVGGLPRQHDVSEPQVITTIVGHRPAGQQGEHLESQQQQLDCGVRHSVRPPVRTVIQPIESCVPVVITANIRGGFTKKSDELETVMRLNNVAIASITETWLT